MKTVKFMDIAEMAYDMVQNQESGKDVTAVTMWKEAKALLKQLLMFDDVEPGWIEVAEPIYDDYDKEYYVSLIKEIDGAFSVFIEKAYKDGLGPNRNRTGYLFTESDIAYVFGDVHSSILDYISAKRTYEVEIVDSFEDFEEEHEGKTKMPVKKTAAKKSKKETGAVAKREDVKEIPLDIEVEVNITTDRNGETAHLVELENALLDVIDELLDEVFYEP